MWDRLADEAVRVGVTIEHAQDGERELVLDAAGQLVVRELPGPRRYRGQEEPPRAERALWRARVPADRLGAILAGLRLSAAHEVARADAFAPSASGASSSLRVVGAGVTLAFDLLALRPDVPPAFARAVAEVTGLARLCAAHPPCAWRRAPDGDAMQAAAGALARAVASVRRALGAEPEAEADRVDPEAERALQAAIDRFYAEWLGEPGPASGDAAARLASSPGTAREDERSPARAAPRAPEPPEPPPEARAPAPALRDAARAFRCAVDPEAVAGTVTLRVGARPMWLEVAGFALVPRTGRAVDARQALRAADALEREDAAALHALDPEIAPFFCPACARSYASARWRAHELSPSKVDGTCPRGHTRPLCRD